MNIVARDYQDAAHNALYKYFGEHKGNPVVAMPTGTGKSIVIGMFMQSALTLYPGTKILALTHVKELIEQNLKTLLKLWPQAPAGVYSAGIGRREHEDPITFAGIQSVHKKPELFGHVDLILIDEGHLVSPRGTTMYRKFIDALTEQNPKLKVIGFSATPFRLGQGLLTDTDKGLFTDISFDLTSREAFNWLLDQGWLSRLVPKRTNAQLDTSGVGMSGGEFILKQLQEKVDQETVTMAALSEAAQLAGDRKHWLVFASGVTHAEHVRDYLETQFGISAGCVHSKMSNADRDQQLRDFKAGRLQAMVNNNILTTGFDYPDIDCVVMLRPTASPGLWVQMLGRGTRPIYADGYDLSTAEGRLAAIAAGPKPHCLVLDFANNTRRLGPINDPVLPRARGKGPKGIAPVKLCETCGCYSHASCRFCENPACGAEFPKHVKIAAEASTDELIASGGDVPIIEHEVNRVTYQIHHKSGKPDSMKVTYFCGFRKFREYICLDHGGYARRVAKQWWELRLPAGWTLPPDTHKGMQGVSFLPQPVRIRVLESKKYPEIVGYEF